MQTTITSDLTGCALGATQHFEQEVRKFVSFSSNAYSDSLATLTYLEDNKEEEYHYSKKASPLYVAQQIVEWGLSAPFLAATVELINNEKCNTEATAFYKLVEQEILTIATYKVGVSVYAEQTCNPVTERWDIYTYNPFILRSSRSQDCLVITLPVTVDYSDLLTSEEVVAYTANCRTIHEATLAEKALAKLNAELAYEQGRTQATDLLVGATFIGLNGNTLRFLSTDGVEFSVYASMRDYDECALIVGGNEI